MVPVWLIIAKCVVSENVNSYLVIYHSDVLQLRISFGLFTRFVSDVTDETFVKYAYGSEQMVPFMLL